MSQVDTLFVMPLPRSNVHKLLACIIIFCLGELWHRLQLESLTRLFNPLTHDFDCDIQRSFLTHRLFIDFRHAVCIYINELVRLVRATSALPCSILS